MEETNENECDFEEVGDVCGESQDWIGEPFPL
jgi:hypothetical protein